MIVRGKVNAWISINDIRFRVPPAGKGVVVIPDDKALSSLDLMSLVRGGMVDIMRESRGVRPAAIEGIGDGWLVPGKVLWEGHAAVPVNATLKPFDGSGLSAPAKPAAPKPFEKHRKYRIRRNCASCIAFEKPRVALSKMREEAELDVDGYYDEEVQKSLMSGKIVLMHITEPRVGADGGYEMVRIEAGSPDGGPPGLAPAGAPCVFWEGPIFDGGGYANMNRQFLFHLTELGIHAKPTVVSTLMDVEDAIRDRLMALARNLVPMKSPKVYATNLPGRHVGRCISYTMMETEGRVHKDLVAGMANANEVWVPSEWNRQTFMAGGYTGDIRVMPLGVDEKTYHPAPRSVAFDCGTAGFTFLSVFNWNWRKGPDILLRAYAKAFTAKDDVCLVMVSRYVGQTKLSSQILSDIREYVGGESVDRPRLVLVDEVIPTFLMPRLYNSADAFALFTRGEGWLLPAIEAGASGLPVLSGDHGGQKMFLDGEVATLVVPDKVVRVHKSVEWISPFYHGMNFVDYSDKAVDEAAAKMRWMYENRAQLAPKAEALRHRILQGFTWRHAAEKVAARIREIQP